jgi:hypothetical protein
VQASRLLSCSSPEDDDAELLASEFLMAWWDPVNVSVPKRGERDWRAGTDMHGDVPYGGLASLVVRRTTSGASSSLF